MISLEVAALVCLWYALAFMLLLDKKQGEKAKAKTGRESYWHRQDRQLKAQAAGCGVTWSSRETLSVWGWSLACAAILYRLTGNLLLLTTGWFSSVFLPSLLIQRRHSRKRLQDLAALTDCLRQLVSRLPDQGSFVRALEVQIALQPLQPMTPVLRHVLEELRLGSGLEEALALWQQRVRLRKFDNVAQTMLQAQREGWTSQAVKALDKAVHALEQDRQAVELAAQKAAGRKRQLYLTLAAAWSFPLTLSLFSTGGENIFLNTLPGQLLLAAYAGISLFVLARGQDYISLDVEEL